MKDKLIVWKLILLFFVVLLTPQIALSDTYTFANWQPPGFNYSAGPVYPDGDGNCIAYLRQSLIQYPDTPNPLRHIYEDAEIKANLTSAGLDLGIYHMHAKYNFSLGSSSWAKAIAREEFTVGGPGGAVDALINLKVDGTLFITNDSIHVHFNSLRVRVYIRRIADNHQMGSYDKDIVVWNDGGYGYINNIGGPVEFINYTNAPYILDPVPFEPIPGNGKMLIFDAPINVPISNLETGVEYYYIVEIRNNINYRGATDTFQTLKFDPDLPPIQFGIFDGDPEPGNFIPAPDQEVFTVQSETGALGVVTGGGDLQVDMDIKPGSDENKINLKSKGVIPVVIFATPDFDPTTVDPETVEFGPDGALESHGRGHLEDVDEDDVLDLVLHFRTQETGIECDDPEVFLTGETYDGQYFEGSDNIVILGCK